MRQDVLTEEILAAVGEMKNHKADGIDNIPIYMLKTLRETAVKEIVRL